MIREHFLRASLVEAEIQRRRVRTGVRDLKEIQDGRNEPFARRTVNPFRKIEHEIRARAAEFFVRVFVRFHRRDVVPELERVAKGINRRRRIPLGEKIRGKRVRCRRSDGAVIRQAEMKFSNTANPSTHHLVLHLH